MSEMGRKEDYGEIEIGKYELFFKKSYKVINTINDFLIGIWFLIGSILFFYDSLKNIGIWLFFLGSVQLLIRPTIKLVHDFHLRKYLKEGYRNK
ncbi:YrhK family protein [Priestia megaterium]|uniref:YrhK family protein n=1 Tax=Priestia megaterium TaxID=1404 RepID=UPI00159C7620|nr:YrhK family protein [Priestia megaterium]